MNSPERINMEDEARSARVSSDLRERLGLARAKAEQQLLTERNRAGYWTGELSSSALSTATAVTALAIYQRSTSSKLDPRLVALISSGLDWLAQHANADGGWGDTLKSISNISTTALCWAAFGAVPGADEQYAAVVQAAECWLRKHSTNAASSGNTVESLCAAVVARYGEDRTFSVPILTMCALAGRLGSGEAAWSRVIPLPFELAAFPREWFAALKLPVVSYALPALIAIGQARHFHSPSGNIFVRAIRNATRNRTLRVLKEIQPSNGGFLEATPLTSFVVMSLAGSGQGDHLVTQRGVEFLVGSQRKDGSWPIDTNLATWVTTLAVNALQPSSTRKLAGAETLRAWLLKQQFFTRHLYTGAAPGAWGWTDLPGGVPDADDTAGALLALSHLGLNPGQIDDAIVRGIEWLLNLQNSDGGIPTFCRGWGTLPFDRSAPDLTAHSVRAWLAWYPDLSEALQSRIDKSVTKALRYFGRTQRADGSWVPLWFGNQHSTDEANPVYGTARVLIALADLASFQNKIRSDVAKMMSKAVKALLGAQHEDGSWSAEPGKPPSIEETALAVEALAACYEQCEFLRQQIKRPLHRGTLWLIEQVEGDAWKEPAPIGFYFAKLWYFETLYPQIFTVAALNRVANVYRGESPL